MSTSSISPFKSKMMRVSSSLFMILAILLSFNFKVGMSDDDSILPPKEITVTINNKLNMKLGLHCKDKHSDFGFVELQVGESWSFEFYNPFRIWFSPLYWCMFTWYNGQEVVHYFDIYVGKRDWPNRCSYLCVWDIFEAHPCRVTGGEPECFPWKNN
ncbi:S-protein homolog 19-like [Arachis duranensis]|uniref:S-protein homolog n=1 Tax=Arachis duranensis TaxID=130453 RepID=A0A6P4DKV6_ARADU|nr:S-protein homolog 19-like [Arachis duranensis]